MQTISLMNEHFDERDYYEREVAPLLKKLHEACAERNLPLFAAVCYGNNASGNQSVADLSRAMFFTGPERTPLSFRVCEAAVAGDSADAFALSGLLLQARPPGKKVPERGSGTLIA